MENLKWPEVLPGTWQKQTQISSINTFNLGKCTIKYRNGNSGSGVRLLALKLSKSTSSWIIDTLFRF